MEGLKKWKDTPVLWYDSILEGPKNCNKITTRSFE